jgi:hypothetical protein
MEVSGQLHAPAALLPGKETFGTHWIRGWVGTRASLNAVAIRKFPAPAGDRTPAFQPVAQLLFWLSYPLSEWKL